MVDGQVVGVIPLVVLVCEEGWFRGEDGGFDPAFDPGMLLK